MMHLATTEGHPCAVGLCGVDKALCTARHTGQSYPWSGVTDD